MSFLAVLNSLRASLVASAATALHAEDLVGLGAGRGQGGVIKLQEILGRSAYWCYFAERAFFTICSALLPAARNALTVAGSAPSAWRGSRDPTPI